MMQNRDIANTKCHFKVFDNMKNANPKTTWDYISCFRLPQRRLDVTFITFIRLKQCVLGHISTNSFSVGGGE